MTATSRGREGAPRGGRRRRGALQAAPALGGALSLAFTVALLACDASNRRLFGRAHDTLAAVSLALIGVACLAHHAVRGAARREWLRATIVAVAFFLWSLNQVWPDPSQAVLLNDAAIAAFVADVFLAIVDWPARAPSDATGPRSA